MPPKPKIRAPVVRGLRFPSLNKPPMKPKLIKLLSAALLLPSAASAALLSQDSFSGYGLGELPFVTNPAVTGYTGNWAGCRFRQRRTRRHRGIPGLRRCELRHGQRQQGLRGQQCRRRRNYGQQQWPRPTAFRQQPHGHRYDGRHAVSELPVPKRSGNRRDDLSDAGPLPRRLCGCQPATSTSA